MVHVEGSSCEVALGVAVVSTFLMAFQPMSWFIVGGLFLESISVVGSCMAQ